METNIDPVQRSRRDLLADEFDSLVQWAMQGDPGKAARMGEIAYELETMAFAKGADKMVEVMAERDAAWADLHRIKMIVNNPMMITPAATQGEVVEQMTAAAQTQP